MDREATARSFFLDKRSFVALDGSLRLYGQDVSVQRHVVMVRDNFRCVKCGANRYVDMDHIKKRNDGGSEDLENLQLLCRACHTEKHGRVPRWSKKATVFVGR